MTTTTTEKVGDIILGAHLVHCRHRTEFDKKGILRHMRGPLDLGKGGPVEWTKEETKAGGWHRKVPMSLDTSSDDPSRATSYFKVVKVSKVPPSDPGYNGRDAGFGGGTEILVKRLDGKGERIRYTRGCTYFTDYNGPVTLVTP